MKKKYWIFFAIIIMIVFIIGTIVVVDRVLASKKTVAWYKEHMNISDSTMGDGVKEVVNDTKLSIFDEKYQKAVNQKVNELLDKTYSMNQPLILYNPYGTNTTAFNFYFTTTQAGKVQYKISVENEKISDYENTLNTGMKSGITKNHQYQVIGFVPGETNTVTLTLLSSEDEVLEQHSFKIILPALQSKVDTQVSVTKGNSINQLTEGLFTVLGHDKNYNSNIYLYDNSGVLRGELTLEDYRTDRIIWTNHLMIYNYNKHGLIAVNRLGKIVQFYDLGKYEMHHDFIYDEQQQRLLILASDTEDDSIEDIVIALDLTTGEVSEVLDMKNYFESAYLKAKDVGGKNAYGNTLIDWMHLNSLQLVDGTDLILSSRELSSIIRINNIDTTPTIDYVIADESVWQDSSISEYNLTKEGEFVSQAGQHSLEYSVSNTLENGQYYIAMFNNNYAGARSRPNFDWSNYPNAGSYQDGEHSMYYKYLVDEENKTYELVASIELPYSSVVSSVQHVADHIITSSGMSHCFEEYDADGDLIQSFTYTSKKYAYRVLKYHYQNYWFQ